MTTRSKYYERAYARLRSARPAGVDAIVDGEAIELAVKRGASKGKWDRVLAAAQKLNAEGLQLRDADGAVLEILDLADRKEQRAELARTEDDELGAGVAQFAKVMDIALNASDRAVQRQSEQMTQVLDAALGLMRIATDRLERTERALEKIIRAHHLALERGGGGGKTSTTDDFIALISAAKASGFDVERFFGSMTGSNGSGADYDDDDLEPITPDHISPPGKQ